MGRCRIYFFDYYSCISYINIINMNKFYQWFPWDKYATFSERMFLNIDTILGLSAISWYVEQFPPFFSALFMCNQCSLL